MLSRIKPVRVFLIGVSAAAAMLATSAYAQEARAPKGAIEIVVGSNPGGSVDLLMRRVVKILSEEGIVENPLAVVNRPGGSWSIAVNYVKSKPGDENILLAHTQVMLTAPIAQGKGSAYREMTPIATFVQAELMFVVGPDFPAKDLKELVAMVKKDPRSVKSGGANIGSPDSMTVSLLSDVAGVDIPYVPFTGAAPALAAFLSGDVNMLVVNPDEALPLVKDGKAKMTALLSEQRRLEPEFAKVQTAKEQGFDVVFYQEWGLQGPPKLDPAVVKWWEDKLGRMVKTDAWKQLVAENYYRSDFVHGDALMPYLDKYFEKHRKIMDKLGMIKK